MLLCIFLRSVLFWYFAFNWACLKFVSFLQNISINSSTTRWTKSATWRQEQKSKKLYGSWKSQNTKRTEIVQYAGDLGIVFDLTFNPHFTSNRFIFINVMWLFYVAVLDLSGIKILFYSWLAWRFWQPTGKTTMIMKKNLKVAPIRCICRCADSSMRVVKETEQLQTCIAEFSILKLVGDNWTRLDLIDSTDKSK